MRYSLEVLQIVSGSDILLFTFNRGQLSSQPIWIYRVKTPQQCPVYGMSEVIGAVNAPPPLDNSCHTAIHSKSLATFISLFDTVAFKASSQ